MESLSRVIEQLKNATIMDEEVVNECLNKIARALRQSDVQIKLVHDMKTNIKKLLDDAGHNNKQIIFLHAIFDELCKMLDHPVKLSFTPNKGNPTVVMFVGPQGSGKTTTCAKYAYYHQNKGWKPALVCSDTSSAAAFHQLKQIATSTNIPFYGSCMESDPVKIAVEGVETFKKDNCDLIVVDTSAYLVIEDIREVYEATKPDLVILVLDSSDAHAALDQAQEFSDHSVAPGAVILTKMDCHAMGCGALSAVATSKNPVIFLGTGKLMDEFESFDVSSFVSHLLGEFVSMDQQLESLKKLSEENCTLRIMHEQYQKMEVVLAVVSTICQLPPGLMPDGRAKKRLADIKKYMRIMNSMTDKELDSTNPEPMNESRMMQIAKASNLHMNEVVKTFEEYRRFADIWNVIKGLQFHKKEDMRLLVQYMNALQENMVIPPQLLRVSADELQKLLKQMECSLVAMRYCN